MGISSSRSSTCFHVVEDPTVRVELYTWSSVEFRDEYALVYTSRSNPSQFCISHYRVNPVKVLFTIHDCLCEGDRVRVVMEFGADRDNHGLFVFRDVKVNESSGTFAERIEQPGLFEVSYTDIYHYRISGISLCKVMTGHELQFGTGFEEGPLLKYLILILCHPLKGLYVDLSGPRCEYLDGYVRRPKGSCFLNHVSGMPPHDILKQKKQGNEDVGATVVSTQSTAILNAGQTQGNFNNSNYRDCKIVIDAQATQFKGSFHHST